MCIYIHCSEPERAKYCVTAMLTDEFICSRICRFIRQRKYSITAKLMKRMTPMMTYKCQEPKMVSPSLPLRAL